MPGLADTSLSASERRVVSSLLELLPDAFGGDLHAVWLYGSRARGEPRHPESDVDLLVITTTGSFEDQRRVNRLIERAARELEANPWAFSAIVLDAGWPKRRRAVADFFVAEVDRDKVVLAGAP